MQKSSQFKVTISFIEILLAGICFGFLGIFGRLAFKSGLSIGELLSFRFSMAGVLLWLGLGLFRPKNKKSLSPKQISISVMLGVFGYAVFSTMYFEAIKGVSVAIAAMLLFTFPIFVNIGAHFFLKQHLAWKQWFSLLLAMMGLVFLLWGDVSVNSVSSLFWGVGAAMTYAIYVLVSGQIQRDVDPWLSSAFVISAAALALAVFHRPDWTKLVQFGQREWFIVGGIAIVGTILPLTLFLSGMQKISSSKASIIVMIEPVTAAVAGWLILGETLGFQQIIGGCLVIIALFFNRK